MLLAVRDVWCALRHQVVIANERQRGDVRGELCPIVRTWVELERSIWAGFTCATLDAADAPIMVPSGAEPYDFSRFTLYVRGQGNGAAMLDRNGQVPDGLQTFAAPALNRAEMSIAVNITTSTDGRTIEFRSAQYGEAFRALQGWSRANTALIEERFERLESGQDELGWLIRVHLAKHIA